MPEERVEALDISTQLAIAAGIEALRDAGIPLVMNYKKTSRGTSCQIDGNYQSHCRMKRELYFAPLSLG